MKFNLRTLILAVGTCAVLCLILRLAFVVPNVTAENHIRTSPIQTAITHHPNGEMSSDRITYSIGQYGVTEFGSIRLAIRGCTFSGESSGGLILSSNSTLAGGSGSTGVGNRRFTRRGIIGGSSCTFGGLSFTIVKGELTLCNKQFGVDGPPRVIIIDKTGKIEAVEKLPDAAQRSAAQQNVGPER